MKVAEGGAAVAHCTFEITPRRLRAILSRMPANHSRLLTKLQRIAEGEQLPLTVRQASDVRTFLLR